MARTAGVGARVVGSARAVVRSRDRRVAAALVVLAVFPFVVAGVHLFLSKQGYVPLGDISLIELRTRDVFRHPVLVGPYSRYGWNHPGGLLYYLLAGPYLLFGSRSIGLLLGGLIVNVSTIVGIALIAFRRGGLPMVVAAIVPVMLYTGATGWEAATSPWNPYLPLLPFLLVLFVVWSVLVGDLWLAPVAVALMSFCLQSHVGFAIEAAALSFLVVVTLVARGLRAGATARAYWRRLVRVALASVATAAVLWAPVIIGDLRADESNFGLLIDFFSNRDNVAGLGFGLEFMGALWGMRPDWIVGERPWGYIGIVGVERQWWLAPILLAGVATTFVAWRRHARETLWFAAVVGVSLAAALLGVSRISGVALSYLVRWAWMPHVALGTLVLRGAWLAVPDRHRLVVGRVLAPLVLGFGLVLCVVHSASALNVKTPREHEEREVAELVDQVVAALPAGRGPVRFDLRRGDQFVAPLALQLERRGIPVDVPEDQAFIFGPERARRGGPYRSTLVFVRGRPRDGLGRLVWRSVDRVTERQRREASRNIATMEELLGRKLTRSELRRATPTEVVESLYLDEG